MACNLMTQIETGDNWIATDFTKFYCHILELENLINQRNKKSYIKFAKFKMNIDNNLCKSWKYEHTLPIV